MLMSAVQTSNALDVKNDYEEFLGPKINWEVNKNSPDTADDLIGKSMQKKDSTYKGNNHPASDFLQSEYLKTGNYKNITDSLLDNIDFKSYSGSLLERFRMTFFSDPYTPTAIEIGKYRPGKFILIVKFTTGEILYNHPYRASKGLQYFLIDSLKTIDSLKCSKIMTIVRNFHPIDTGSVMNCFHSIEYFCCSPMFSTFFQINCARVEDNPTYFELLKDCKELIQSNISKENIQKSYLYEFINDVSAWDSAFYKTDKVGNKKVKNTWRFFNSHK
jgi:hypothetical protein